MIASDQGEGSSFALRATSAVPAAQSSMARVLIETGRWQMPMSTRPMATSQAPLAKPSTTAMDTRLIALKNGKRIRNGRNACTAKPANASAAIWMKAVLSIWNWRSKTSTKASCTTIKPKFRMLIRPGPSMPSAACAPTTPAARVLFIGRNDNRRSCCSMPRPNPAPTGAADQILHPKHLRSKFIGRDFVPSRNRRNPRGGVLLELKPAIHVVALRMPIADSAGHWASSQTPLG
jgi:hypothetical protein